MPGSPRSPTSCVTRSSGSIDVQILLDAALIASEGVRLDFEWVEPADIVNAAVEPAAAPLGGHKWSRSSSGGTAVHPWDPVLLEQALGQIIDNAAKYSRRGFDRRLAGGGRGCSLVLSVTDEGIGLSGRNGPACGSASSAVNGTPRMCRGRASVVDRESLRHRQRRRNSCVQRRRRSGHGRVDSAAGGRTGGVGAGGGRRCVMPPSW